MNKWNRSYLIQQAFNYHAFLFFLEVITRLYRVNERYIEIFFETDSLIIILHLPFDVSSTNLCYYFVTDVHLIYKNLPEKV